MSYQAQTAVTYHSQQTKLPLLRLLMVFAEKANSVGVIDPAPNQDTLAEIFDVTARTIRTRIGQLIESGELEQTRVGSGPGNPSAYRICLPLDCQKVEAKVEKVETKVEANPVIISTLLAEIEQLKVEIEALKVEVFQAKVEDFAPKGGKGGSQRWKPHSFKNADEPYTNHDPLTKAKDLPPPPIGKGGKNGGGGGHPLELVLKSAGIAEPKLSALLHLPHLTPEMAQAHLARAPSVAAAIYRMENNWQPPAPPERVRRNHIPAEVEHLIRR